MIKRLVKLTFQIEKAADFQQIFEESKDKIRAFDGNEGVELLRDSDRLNVFFTLSLWRDAEALDAYRQSDLFRQTWAKTKILFAERPEAWSTKVISKADI